MSDKKWGKTLMGLFVENPDAAKSESESPDADADVIAQAAGAQEAASAPPELHGPLQPVVNGAIDFAKVFESAGVDPAAQDRVSKARSLLHTLPAEAPDAIKKQIVEASLKAFGVPTDEIIRAAIDEIGALEAYVRAGATDAQKTAEEGNRRVAALESEIAHVREVIQQALAQQEGRTGVVNVQRGTLQQILDFFGKDAVAKAMEPSKAQQ